MPRHLLSRPIDYIFAIGAFLPHHLGCPSSPCSTSVARRRSSRPSGLGSEICGDRQEDEVGSRFFRAHGRLRRPPLAEGDHAPESIELPWHNGSQAPSCHAALKPRMVRCTKLPWRSTELTQGRGNSMSSGRVSTASSSEIRLAQQGQARVIRHGCEHQARVKPRSLGRACSAWSHSLSMACAVSSDSWQDEEKMPKGQICNLLGGSRAIMAYNNSNNKALYPKQVGVG